MRDHQPIVLDKFNGLFNRGDIEQTPLDHFSDCTNLKYVGPSGFATRDGVGRYQLLAAPLSNILRIYNYPTQNKSTILVLTSGGNIYHVVDQNTIYGPVLTIGAMQDFGFVPYSGRAYITPFATEVNGALNMERGLNNDFLYVYKGDGTLARKAGGTAPTVVITPVISASSGFTDAGTHIFGYVYETDTGYQTSPGGLIAFKTSSNNAVDFSNIANSPDSFAVKKHLVASKVIQQYDGNVNGYTLYFIPGADIPNNTTTTLTSISFFDASLLNDASHLLNNFANIPAGVGLSVYHNRLCIFAEYNNISLCRVSAPGEPEAINQINGLLLVPPDGNPLTNAGELRDIFYLTKRNKTVAYVDNGDVPTTWPFTTVDNAMGAGVHSIGTVLDSGSGNIDYLLVGSYKGLCLFNGRYILPEMTFKIQNYWTAQDFKNNYRRIQIVNDSVLQRLYIVTTDRKLLYADYANGFDPTNIRWCPWTFGAGPPPLLNSVCLVNVNDLLLGMDQI